MVFDIGFIGLGRMGAAMAERLEGRDVRLHVHDPVHACADPFVARGAVFHSSPRATAEAASLVFACLPGPKVSLQVAREVAGAPGLSTYVETSTIGRAAMEAISAVLATHGVALVDAPVSGGPEAARGGRLSMMAAGSPAALAHARLWLDRIAGAVFEVGSAPGLAQAMKLANNLLAAVNLAAGVEALTVVVAAGLDARMALDVINASSGRNSATSSLLLAYVADPVFTYGASVGTMLKDVELALAEARNCGLVPRVAEAAADQWRTIAKGDGADQDILGFVLAQERLTGVSLRASPEAAPLAPPTPMIPPIFSDTASRLP